MKGAPFRNLSEKGLFFFCLNRNFMVYCYPESNTGPISYRILSGGTTRPLRSAAARRNHNMRIKKLHVLALSLWKHAPIPKRFRILFISILNRRFLAAVQGVVRNNEGHILFVRHTYRKKPWGLPGGWMGREQPHAALEREVLEETGLRVSTEKILRVAYVADPHAIEIFLLARLTGGAFRPSAEVSDYIFVSPGEWPEDMPEDHKQLISELMQSID